MTPKYLRLKGFTGILRATGLHEVMLDLTYLEDDDQLVAIIGPNGSAKSTVLDNLQPYPVMPSRVTSDGPVNVDAFSYYGHLYAADCERELHWDHNGEQYKTSQLWHINGSRTAEAYLHIKKNGKWVPASLPDGTLSDGKTSTYAKCVEGIVGNPATYFTTQFAAQNRTQFAKYKSADVKSLLADMLGHSHIETLHAKCLSVSSGLKSALTDARFELEQLVSVVALVKSLHASIAADEATLKGFDADWARQRQALSLAETALVQAQERIKASATTEAERQRLKGEQGKIDALAHADIALLQQDKVQAEAILARAKQERAVAEARLTADKISVEKQLAEINILLAQAPMVVSAQATLPVALTDLPALKAAVEQAEIVRAEWMRLKVDKERAEDKIEQLGKTMNVDREKQEALTLQSGLANEVPCQGTDLQSSCKLLTHAVDAKTRIPAVIDVITKAALTYDQLRNELAATIARMGSIGDAETATRLAKAALAGAEATIRQLEKLAVLAPAIENAESTRVAAQTRLSTIETDAADVLAKFNDHECHHRQRFDDIDARITQRQNQAKQSVADVLDALSKLPVSANPAEIVSAAAQVKAIQNALSLVEADRQQIAQQIGHAKGKLNILAPQSASVDEAKRVVTEIETEMAYWAMLTKAFSKDGIIALSIDDAGPTISGLTNQILAACFGPRFNVSIETQVTKRDGEKKEGFDILIDDANNGERSSLSVMSGGERVWINECISRALALFLAEASGLKEETLFTDETDGALDEDRKRMFMTMKRKVIELGGYKREFFVSHTPQMWDLADAKLRFPDSLCAVETNELSLTD